ncbi:MAG: riboflavin synthase [Candidatus Tyrphobacter sp.]
MFSGIIAYRGRIVEARFDAGGALLRIACEGAQAQRPEPKDSIAIDGVCLTATSLDGDVVAFDIVPETLARSTLCDLRCGDVVNVEYALRYGDRVGGHFVAGHVDTVARIVALSKEGNGKRMSVERPRGLASAIVEKGFVALDGVSVTVAGVDGGTFDVALIPETLSRTTLGIRARGDGVNLEIDALARYAQAAPARAE